MVNPDQSSQAQTPVKRRVIREVRQLFGINERRACRVLGFHRSTQRHRATRDDRDLADKLRTLASVPGSDIGVSTSCCAARARPSTTSASTACTGMKA